MQNLLFVTQIFSFFAKGGDDLNYISKTMSRNDELNSRAEMIEDALQEGYAKGRDEGLAEGVIKGREEGRADAAKRMVASGMTKEQVAAILELSTKEIDIVLAS